MSDDDEHVLFEVRSLTDYRGHEDVRFFWRRRGKSGRPYADLIEGYDSDADAFDAAGAIDELFTATEAALLKDYLDRHHGAFVETTIEEVALPLRNTASSFAASWVLDSRSSYIELDREPEYDLPFGVSGYFRLPVATPSAERMH
jgi:hypothetical protein